MIAIFLPISIASTVTNHYFSLALWLRCWRNQYRNIWCGTHITLLWAFRILDATVSPYIRFKFCLTFVIAVNWIIQVAIPVEPMSGVWNTFRCAILTALDWMTVHSCHLPDIQYFSLSSRQIICRQSWWQRWSFWQFKCSRPSGWNSDEDTLNISSVYKMNSMSVIGMFWSWDSFCVAHRFWLPCHISKKLWTLAIQCSLLSFTSLFISESFPEYAVSNDGTLPAKIPLLAWTNCVATALSRNVSPVVFDCLHLISFHTREKLASTPTPCGMIDVGQTLSAVISWC